MSYLVILFGYDILIKENKEHILSTDIYLVK